MKARRDRYVWGEKHCDRDLLWERILAPFYIITLVCYIILWIYPSSNQGGEKKEGVGIVEQVKMVFQEVLEKNQDREKVRFLSLQGVMDDWVGTLVVSMGAINPRCTIC